ncbi:putative gustatory receptor 28b [Episyrphus balteatus]|uniref:putative gustatory receptor 28b n=1 Tax=Episyrphus balteatus TaxID=286459 RepID=UPI0024859F72|nr:putative gustatory receptor 28b [Episyrphus balteatus]
MWKVLRMIKSRYNDITNPKDVFATLQPIFIVSLLFGTVPIQIVGPFGNRSVKSSYYAIANMMFRLFLSAYIFYSVVSKNESVSLYFFETNVTTFADNIKKINGLVGLSVTIIVAMIKKNYLAKCLILLAKIEKNCLALGICLNYKRAVNVLMLQMLILAALNGSFIVGSIYGVFERYYIHPIFVAKLGFFSPCILITGIVIMFTCITNRITKYFSCLHKVLKNLSNQLENRKIRSVSAQSRSIDCLDSIVKKMPCEIIQESMEIHHLICEAASTANKYFTYQLLTIISIAFLIIVFDAYYVLETLLGKSKRESKFKTFEFVTFFSCQIILYLIAIISIVEGSNRAIKKSEKTSGIICDLLIKAKNLDVEQKFQQFSMQLMHLKINFTAAGLFNVDRTLYFTFSGALTTYLIILLQFTSSAPNCSAPCIFGKGPNATSSIETL